MHRTGTTRAIAAAMEGSTKLRGRCTLSRTPSHWRPALLLVASFLGCGGLVGSGPPPPPPQVTVTVAPATASVPLGEPQTFTATVSNAANTAVSWSVNGIPGGNATVGTIDAGGVYTAPANLPAPASVSVQATSAADNSKTSASLVTITSDISVSVSPEAMPVELGASRPFSATVNSAGNPNRAVTWMLSGSGCTGAACGTVDSSGTYTAPQIFISPPSVSLTAISVADPSKSATGTITVTSSFSLAVTGPSTITAGNTATYAATLTPAANSNPSRVISWSVAGTGCAGAACGTISSSGVYTAPSIPPSPATVQIIATPQADPSKAASVSLSILPAVSVSVSPSAATVALGSAQAFQATVTGAQDTSVTWDVNGVVDGNSAARIDSQFANRPGQHHVLCPASHAGRRIGDRACAQQCQSECFRKRHDHVHGRHQRDSNAGERDARCQPKANLHRPGQQHAQSKRDLAGQRNLRRKFGDGPDLRRRRLTRASRFRPATAAASIMLRRRECRLPIRSPSRPRARRSARRALRQASRFCPTWSSVCSREASRSQAPGSCDSPPPLRAPDNQQVIWSVTGIGCANPGVCGSIDSTGLYTAPLSPVLVEVVATSSEDITQSGTAIVTINNSPGIFSLSPTSAYAGSAGGFTLLVTGNNFSPSAPGPGSMILVAGAARATSCASSTQCITSLDAADLQSAGNLSVQMQNPDGLLSNTQTFVVLAPGSGAGGDPSDAERAHERGE